MRNDTRTILHALYFNPGGEPEAEWRKCLKAKKDAIELYESSVIVFGEISSKARQHYAEVAAWAELCVYWNRQCFKQRAEGV